MKKFRKKLQIAFWVAVVCGVLWAGFMPHGHFRPHHAPSGVAVKVKRPPPGGEEPPLPEIKPVPPPQTGEKAQEKPAPIPVVPPVAQKHTGEPEIAIVIDDVGVDLKGSARAIALPAPVTLSFLPYAVRLREQAAEARANGHELILHMPMEPIGHQDPGPGALLVDLPMSELQRRFETALASFTGLDGVNNHMGSKFTAFRPGMEMVVNELKQRGLFYFDSRTGAQSVGAEVAKENGLPYVTRDVFLDDVQEPDAIEKQLAETERVARRKGYAVAIGHPHAATMDVLPGWIEQAQHDGFRLVPLHDLVQKPE